MTGSQELGLHLHKREFVKETSSNQFKLISLYSIFFQGYCFSSFSLTDADDIIPTGNEEFCHPTSIATVDNMESFCRKYGDKWGDREVSPEPRGHHVKIGKMAYKGVPLVHLRI